MGRAGGDPCPFSLVAVKMIASVSRVYGDMQMCGINNYLVVIWYQLDPMSGEDSRRTVVSYDYVRCPACHVVGGRAAPDLSVMLAAAVPACNQYWVSDRVTNNLETFGQLFHAAHKLGGRRVNFLVDFGEAEIGCEFHRLPFPFAEHPPSLWTARGILPRGC